MNLDVFRTKDPVEEYQNILDTMTGVTPAAAVPLDPDEVAAKATGATARRKVIDHVAAHSTLSTMVAGSVLDRIREEVADKKGKDKDDVEVIKEAARKTAHVANAAGGHQPPHVNFSKPNMLAPGWRVVFAFLATLGWVLSLLQLMHVADKGHPSSAALSALGTAFFLLLMTSVVFVMGYGKVEINSGFGGIGVADDGHDHHHRHRRRRARRSQPHHH